KRRITSARSSRSSANKPTFQSACLKKAYVGSGRVPWRVISCGDVQGDQGSKCYNFQTFSMEFRCRLVTAAGEIVEGTYAAESEAATLTPFYGAMCLTKRSSIPSNGKRSRR